MTKSLRPKRHKNPWRKPQAPQADQRIGFKKWTVEALMEELRTRYGHIQGGFLPQTIRTKFRARPGIVTKALMELVRKGELIRRGHTNPLTGYNGGRTYYWFKS